MICLIKNLLKQSFILENEPIIQNHPLSCYTSKRIDYSAKLNEVLSQEELSSRIIIDGEEANYSMLSEDLGKQVVYKYINTFSHFSITPLINFI